MRKPQIEKQITVIIKRPGEPPEVHPLFDNTLADLQREVGGYIETVTFAPDATIICNGEGLLMGLPYNCSLFGISFVGTIILAGVRGEHFASLSPKSVTALLRILDN